METVILANVVLKNDWANITDNTGREISVFLGLDKNQKPTNPSLKTPLESWKPGDEIKMDVKKGKNGIMLFGWEASNNGSGGGGGKNFTPKDKNWESALSAADAASKLLSLTKDPTPEQFDKFFNHIFTRITEKITK